MENNDRGRIGQATRDVKDYAALYADRLRLGLIENLSTFFNALFGVVVLIVLLWIAAMFFAVALTRVDARRHTVDGRAVRRAGGDRICGTPQADRRSDGQDVRQNGV